MNVTTINIPRSDAIKVINDYKFLAEKQKTREDDRLEEIYEAVAEYGKPVINVAQAFRETGLNEKGEPNLALARADWSMVYFHPRVDFENLYSGNSGGGAFSEKSEWALYSIKKNYVVKRGTFDNAKLESYTIKAKVPMIPVDKRPKLHLRNYHILFEVEEWERHIPKPISRDPFLLKHIAQDLFVILEEWDLTPMEAMLLDAIREE